VTSKGRIQLQRRGALLGRGQPHVAGDLQHAVGRREDRAHEGPGDLARGTAVDEPEQQGMRVMGLRVGLTRGISWLLRSGCGWTNISK